MSDKSSETRAIIAEIQDSESSRDAVAREITAGATQALRKARATGSRTAYAGAANLGLGYSAGYGGSWAALPSVLAQNSPLAVLQYTLSRADKLALYRYFSRIDPMVASAVRLHTELPMSKVTISPPKGPNHDQNDQINKIYQNMSDRVDLEQVLMEITREYLICGDVFIWLEWDDEILEWKEIYCLPTEYVHTVLHPFRRNKEFIFFAKPLVDTAAVRRMTDRDLYMTSNDPQLEELFNEIQDDIPEELRASLDFGEGVPLNTDPSKGSCVVHIARNRTPNEQYGISLLEACVEVLFRLENLKNSQMQISSRNMSPKHLVYGENIGPEQLNDLRAQVDLSLMEPDYVVCVTPETVVTMSNGIRKRIDEIEIGNLVVTAQGNIKPVTRIYKRFIDEPICNIKTSVSPTPLRITSNHNVWLGDLKKPAGELKAGDMLWSVPITLEYNPRGITENQALLLGWFAAEGCQAFDNGSYRTRLSLNPNSVKDSEFIPILVRAMESEFEPELHRRKHKKPRSKPYFKQCHPNCGNIHYSNKKFFDFVASLISGKARTKTLSPEVMLLPKNLQKIILKAWTDGDGHVFDNGSRVATSTSRALRDQMAMLAIRAGLSPILWTISNGKFINEAETRGWSEDTLKENKVQYALYLTVSDCLNLLPDDGGGPFIWEELMDQAEHLRPKVSSRKEGGWTEDRDQILRSFYPPLGAKLVSQILGVSVGSILGRAFNLGLLRNKEGCVKPEVGVFAKVEQNTMTPYTGFVYNIEVEEDHTYQVEGVAVHNCTNYPVDWKTIGANDRLLQVDSEYQTLREDLATGLGTTKEMLTGAATFGGQRITLEMMNQHYLCYRQAMINFVEKCIFRPVAEAKGHFFFEEIEEWIVIEPEDVEAGDELIHQQDGEIRRKRIQENKVYNHSHLRFNRLSIRDNAEVYDQLFMLHQKGSLSLKYLLDIHNIDPEENETALLEDLGTVKDPTFNRLMETLYPAAAEEVIAKTNFSQRIIQGLNLDVISQSQGEPSPATPTMSGAGDLGLDVMGSSPSGGMGAMPPMGPEGAPLPGPDVNVTNEIGAPPPAGDVGLEMSSQGSMGPAGAPPPGIPPTASRKPKVVSDTPLYPGERLSPDVVQRIANTIKTSKWVQRDLSPRAKRKLALKMIQKVKLDIESEAQDA